ncbi:MAG: outer rane adhesin like protein, partial [Solirubrobacterales bacterium]|nr:outer rane adhesin like protein [Solirubrobacterales bacterium]
APGADIEFWGCNVAQGSTGQAFVDTVHTLTGATVGASTDATGAAALGGNWVLEDTTGRKRCPAATFLSGG